jgi:hypothetical protein
MGEGKTMVNSRVIARFGMLAAGVGIGAALAAMPGIASADSSSDWLSSVDSLLGGAFPAADTSSGVNMAISEDGVTIFQEGTAQAYSGTDGDYAIAYGAGSTATAYGTDNYADVDGTDSSAVAGGTTAAGAAGSSDDTAFVDGNDSTAFAGGPGTSDYSEIFGNNDGAFSGGDAAGPGSYDAAYVEGNDLGTAYAQGGDYLADILKTYGDSSTAAAAETSSLADLTTAGDSGNLLTDLLPAIDPGAAGDSGNLLADLASLF